MRHGNNGLDAEKRVAEEYGLEEYPADWCDLENPRTGARYEVKSADPDRERPRFRLWEDQHQALTGASAHTAAWYVFVAGSRMSRHTVGYVSNVVEKRGGWNRSGHRRGSRQLKIPLEDVL
jgi:hypothetical protein